MDRIETYWQIMTCIDRMSEQELKHLLRLIRDTSPGEIARAARKPVRY